MKYYYYQDWYLEYSQHAMVVIFYVFGILIGIIVILGIFLGILKVIEKFTGRKL